MKKRWIAAAFLLTAILSFRGASAYFTDAEIQNNQIDIGSVTTEVLEDFPDPGEPSPGSRITKVVRIRSTGESDCAARVQVLFSDSEAEQICTPDYNTGDWEYEEGWWYYRHVLHTGDVTEPLFTNVSISPDADDIKDFDIYIRQESRQADAGEQVPWN